MAFRTPARRVDQTAIKVNQGFAAGFLMLAYILESQTLILFISLVMLIGTVAPELALFHIFYRDGIRPAGLAKPRIIIDNPEPHRFAQGMGGLITMFGLVALLTDHSALGWAMIGSVILSACLYLLLDLCPGCGVYYLLNRLGVPGFRFSPLRRDV
jgi:hypothetical protein